jgi:hypothetical protein
MLSNQLNLKLYLHLVDNINLYQTAVKMYVGSLIFDR